MSGRGYDMKEFHWQTDQEAKEMWTDSEQWRLGVQIARKPGDIRTQRQEVSRKITQWDIFIYIQHTEYQLFSVPTAS